MNTQLQHVDPERMVVDEAFKRTLLICQLKRRVTETILDLGEHLYHVKQEYEESPILAKAAYQHETFEQYIAAPEDASGVDMSISAVNRMIRIYETYCVKIQTVKPHVILECADYTKLDMIRSVATEENVEEWLFKAKALSRSDLKIEVREAKFKAKNGTADMPECICDYEVVCKKCGKVSFE